MENKTMKTYQFYKIGNELVKRFHVPTQQKCWKVEWKDYKPVPVTINFDNKPWADLDINDPNFHPKWNQLDGNVDRRSFCGIYSINHEGLPINPMGRTGVCKRGLLGRYGPNHAADPIVTRWKRNNEGNIQMDSDRKQILQFIAIERRDVSEWAIPGGMVDPGEIVSQTLKREFFEESLNSQMMDEKEKKIAEEKLNRFFSEGEIIFKGYVDDPRNTDNAWIETIAVNFHDSTGKILHNLNLNAGDDAKNVKWLDIDKNLKLYANHLNFIENIVKNKNAHW